VPRTGKGEGLRPLRGREGVTLHLLGRRRRGRGASPAGSGGARRSRFATRPLGIVSFCLTPLEVIFSISSAGIGLFEVDVYGTQQDSAKKIRIAVAEATRMGGQLIAESLKHRRNNFDVLAFAEESPRAFRELQHYEPHIALISVELPDGPFTGFSVLDRMRASKAKAAAIMLLNLDERELVIDAFRGGARGIFCRGHSFEALPKCIRAVHQGQIWVSNNQLESVIQLISHKRQTHPGRRGLNTLLTPRERDVVELVTKDMKNHEIALELGLKEHTVRNYICQIFEKLSVSTRVGLVLYALGEPAINERRRAP
jgi:two-component system nitrate/nitrite response regulator NarL